MCIVAQSCNIVHPFPAIGTSASVVKMGRTESVAMSSVTPAKSIFDDAEQIIRAVDDNASTLKNVVGMVLFSSSVKWLILNFFLSFRRNICIQIYTRVVDDDIVGGLECVVRIETTFGVNEGEREMARRITPYGELIDIDGKHTLRVVSQNAIDLPDHFKKKLKGICDRLPLNATVKEMSLAIHDCFWTFCVQLRREGGGKMPIEFLSE